MSKPPAKNNPARFILLVTVLVVVAVTIGVVVWKMGWFGLTASEPKYETPPLSADYLPSDTTAVLRVNLRETQNSKFVKKNFGPTLRQFRGEYASAEMQKPLGLDAEKDVEWMQMSFPAGELEHPLLLLSGKFEPAKFQTSPNGLRQIKEPPGDRYRLYALPYSPINGTLTLTASETLLLMSDKALLVTKALEDGADGRRPVLQDKMLEELLQDKKKVDRKQTIWGAVTLKKPKPILKVQEPVGALLNQIVADSDAVYGGIHCADDVQGTLYFQTSSVAKAIKVEEVLKELRTTAKAAGTPFGKLVTPEHFQPVMELLATGEITRSEDNTVKLSCQRK